VFQCVLVGFLTGSRAELSIESTLNEQLVAHV
jgi:hypothetical protein